jgi:hypothetical protein
MRYEDNLTQDPVERAARRRAHAKMGWYTHATVYIVVNAMLALIAVAGGRNWAVYPALGWGLGLAIHGAVVWLVTGGGGLYGSLLRKERERLSLQREPW